jgi:hypothetical protein
MIKLSPDDSDANTFLDDIIAAKNNTITDPTYKIRVGILTPNVKLKFSDFEKENSKNNLASLVAHGYSGNDKADLLKLYKYKSKSIQKFKKNVTTTATNRVISTCQNCTINEINSFDHIVPKDEFPEFAVNPKNLFPSCTVCNGHKSTIWRAHGVSLFLNLYLDDLPEVQYLFAELIFEGGVFTARFTIENENNISPDKFTLINNHYTKLHLPQRFRENSHDTIYEVTKEINNYKDKMSREVLLATIRESILKDKGYYGRNHWRSVLKEALINNEAFIHPLFVTQHDN